MKYKLLQKILLIKRKEREEMGIFNKLSKMKNFLFDDDEEEEKEI